MPTEPRPRGPGLVAFVAVALHSKAEAIEEGGDGVAVPLLEAVTARVDASAAALIGEDCDLVHEVGVLGPAGRDHACGRIPDVLSVEPGHDILQPLPQFLAELPLAAGRWVSAMTSSTLRPEYISLQDAAVLYAVNVDLLRHRIATGELPAAHADRRLIRVRIDDLRRMFRPLPAARRFRASA